VNREPLAYELFQLLRHPALEPNAERWRQLLAFADRTHLTLQLHGNARLPRDLEQQVEERWRKNAARRARLQADFLQIESELNSRAIPYVLLKGFTHETGFGLRFGSRVQSDLDFLVAPEDRERAAVALKELGYRPHGAANLSAEHERPWVRPFTWTWRGDYFDPDMPIPVELHDSVWSSAGDRIQCPGLEEFWNRCVPMTTSAMCVQAFAEVDRIAFAALHALRHILRNDATPAHVFELAQLLETRMNDVGLWNEWLVAHHPEVRLLQAIAFRFAQEWFECRLPSVVAHQCEQLPAEVSSWLKHFAWSPIKNLTGANKDVLWLHMALLKSRRDRWRVASRRLLPLRVPHEKLDARLRYHASALLPALKGGVRWWWRRTTSSTISHTSD
jgi:hypothetical protein